MLEYGIFNNEGCLESGFYSEAEAVAAREARYSGEDCVVTQVCPDHEGEQRFNCEECLAAWED